MIGELVSIGRRDATERMAELLVELSARLRLVGLAGRKGYVCPLSQNMLADALGLSSIHVNRVLRELHEEGLCTFQNGRVVFDDFEGLVKLARRDHGYLDCEGPLLP